MSEGQPSQPVIIVASTKSTGLAIILALLFGPLGLLYSSVLGAIVMFLVSILVIIFTAGLGLILTQPICAVWAALAAMSHNKKLLGGIYRQPIESGSSNVVPDVAVTSPPTTVPGSVKVVPHPPAERIETAQSIQESPVESVAPTSPWPALSRSRVLYVLLALLLVLGVSTAWWFEHTVPAKTGNFVPSTPYSSGNGQVSMIKNQFIADTYLGTIGNKDLKLFIEKVDGDNVEGYDVSGSVRRAVKGRIVNKWTKPTGLGGNYTVFKLVLTEPGDEKWDGEFNIDLSISDIDRHGEGSWKSFNGKLEHNISIKDRH
jgi:hypothetical protein